MNRPPGPNDFWFKEHQLTCGGQFIKVREPEKPVKEKKTKNEPKINPKTSGVEKWLIPSPKNKPKDKPFNNLSRPKAKPGSNGLGKPKNKPGSSSKDINKAGSSSNNINKPGSSGLKTKGGSKVITINKWNTNTTDEPGIQKLGNTTNNIHGFGTGNPGATTAKTSTGSISSGSHFSFSGTVGGSSTGRSRLLEIFSPISAKPQSQLNDKKNQTPSELVVKCPICNDLIFEKKANEHIDACLIDGDQKKKTPFVSSTPRFTPGQNEKGNFPDAKDTVRCPVCYKSFTSEMIIDHIDLCLALQDKPKSSSVRNEFDSPPTSVISPVNTSPSVILIEDSPQKNNSPIVIDDSESETEIRNKKRKSNGLVDSCFKVPKLAKTDDIIANCPVCVKEINVNDMNRHLDECLAGFDEDIDLQEAGPSRKSDSIEKDQNENAQPEKCLICNEILDPSVSLIQHLDDCLKNMFDDDTDSLETTSPIEDKNSNPTECEPAIPILLAEDSFKDETQEENNLNNLSELGKLEVNDDKARNRSPCPVCMSRIPQKKMNTHLDVCLG